SDMVSLKLRAQTVEEMELKELQRRDAEITRIQEKRLQLLRQALRDLRVDHEALSEERRGRLVSSLTDVKNRKLSQLANYRLRALRRSDREKATIVEGLSNLGRGEALGDRHLQAHNDPASTLYAPVPRNGIVPPRLTGGMDIQPAALRSLRGVLALERKLERRPAPELMMSHIPTGQNARRWEAKKSLLKAAMAQVKAELATTATSQDNGLEGPGLAGPLLGFEARWEEKREESPMESSVRLTGPPPEGEEMDVAVLLLTRVLRGRAMQNEMLMGVSKSAALIEELRACEGWTRGLLADDRVGEDEQLGGISTRLLEEGVLSSLIGSTVGRTLDQLSKELLKSKEERRIAAMVWLANHKRRLRQIKESGLRQAEERMRAREDTISLEVAQSCKRAADSYLNDIFDSTVGKKSREVALTAVERSTRSFDHILNRLDGGDTEASAENALEKDTMVVKQLVNCFLFPLVERSRVKEQLRLEEKRFVHAAYKPFSETVEDVSCQLTAVQTVRPVGSPDGGLKSIQVLSTDEEEEEPSS
ncbi:MYCBP AMY-1-associated, testis expressed 1, partial [Perkinsus olseni]